VSRFRAAARQPARIPRAWGLTGAAAVLLALATACSSSGSSSSSSPASTPASTAPASGSSSPGQATSGSAYTIGNISSVTGPYASSIGGTPGLITAWQDWTNAHGGINGHPVKVITLDDASVPSKGIADAKQLIADHVAAIVGPASNTVATWYNLAVAAGIPVIGGQVNGGSLYQSVPLLFPTGTTGYSSVLAAANASGKNKVAVMYCSEVPVCAASVQLMKDELKAGASTLGSTQIAYTGAVSGSAPNYTAACLAAQSAGATSLFVSDGASVTLRVVNDCASQGYKPLIIGYGASIDQTALPNSLFSGAMSVQTSFPWFAAKNAAQRDYQNAIKQYYPSLRGTVLYNPNESQVWASFEVFKAAIEQAKPAQVTPATTLAALYTLPKGFSIPGITPPLTYLKGKPNPNVTCYFTVEIRSSQWTAPGPATATGPS
jgi:branched-chain amino acid transport system substrate-binding protein